MIITDQPNSIQNLVYYYENKPLSKRFKSFSPNKHIKSTVRGNLSTNYWERLNNPHTSLLNITTCSSSGKLISYLSPFNDPPEITNAILKHYYYKSFEEFCIKQKRGKGDHKKEGNKLLVESSFKNFYLSNKNDTEKLKIVLRIFNDTLKAINISTIITKK